MTVHSPRFATYWQWADRCGVPIFRRVTKVSLSGPQYTSRLLPHLAAFSDLRELELVETSVAEGELAAWKSQHPHVAVTVNRPAWEW